MTEMAAHPDLDRLLVAAEWNRRPVSIERAQQELGNLFGDMDLSDETLVLRGGTPIALTPATWRRLVRTARTRQRRP